MSAAALIIAPVGSRAPWLWLLVSLAALAPPTLPLARGAQPEPVTIADYLRRETDPDQSLHTLGVARSEYLAAIYAPGGDHPLWTRPSQIRELIDRLAQADADGLDPADYHLPRLQTFLARPAPSAAEQAQLDILLTDALARYAYHLRFGKANPHDIDPNWNYSRALETNDPARWLREAIVEDRVGAALDWLRPQTPMYAALRSALRRYREIVAAGGWRAVPTGPTVKPGAIEQRVSVLRARLARGAIGEHEPELAAAPDPNMFGPHLERAVREFQARHGLTVDGFVGTRTLAALNVTAEHRVQQLRINLERIRWVFRDIEDELLVVNIAAFHAAYIRRGEILWRARAVVGRPYRQTPIFKAGMTHIIANPTWTIPPTILREDILPAMAKDPAYLGRKHLRIYDRGGAEVAAESIDWTRTRSGGFPYVLRQGPGPGNALGRIKFMFPNPHFVYLHDTPSRALFERAERTFSSGCIRVERPFELASLLLDSDPDWVPAKVLESGRTRRFNLDHDVTVMLLYLTAFADENGEVLFRRDIYDRDPAVMRALSGPFRFAPPRGYQGKN